MHTTDEGSAFAVPSLYRDVDTAWTPSPHTTVVCGQMLVVLCGCHIVVASQWELFAGDRFAHQWACEEIRGPDQSSESLRLSWVRWKCSHDRVVPKPLPSGMAALI